ncbi:MAG: methionyl-tRNA formyltransferase [Proteobacteria bacterium]|nr:methionyl-tRNA formyltransferase [Pseudomonadota bacterium]
MKPLRLIFMGTPEFAVPSLKALVESPHQVVAVYTQPPRKSGRGMKESKSPVHRFAEDHGISVLTPENFKDKKDLETFKALGAEVAVVAAYGLILPEAILTAPSKGCLNIHASLLPKFRGAAPIQRAIEAGETVSGNTIMKIEKGLDAGAIIIQEQFTLKADETAGSLHDRLSDQAAGMIVPALEGYVAGKLVPKPQDETKATYAPKVKKSESRINWNAPAIEVDRNIRAFCPYPGAWFQHRGKRIRILKGHAVKASGAPGEVLDKSLTVACKTGAYRIERVQRAGKKPMTAAEFLRGQPIAPGEVLG